MDRSGLPVIAIVLRELGKASSRVGRTHLHKTLFLAEEWLDLPVRHRFSLYLHGPYSRELDGEIQALQAVGVVAAERDLAGYGARYSLVDSYGEKAASIAGLSDGQMRGIAIVAGSLAPLNVKELEAIATAEFVRRSDSQRSDEGVVDAVRQLKPHISRLDIEKALGVVKELHAKVAESQAASS